MGFTAFWAIEECFRTTKNETGLDHYQMRAYSAWYRHITLSMTSAAFLTILRRDAQRGSPVGARDLMSLTVNEIRRLFGPRRLSGRTRPRACLAPIELAPSQPGRSARQPLQTPQALGHRLRRLAAPVEHQSPCVHRCCRPLILARERREHLIDKRIETFTDICQGCGIHRDIISRIMSKLEPSRRCRSNRAAGTVATSSSCGASGLPIRRLSDDRRRDGHRPVRHSMCDRGRPVGRRTW